MPNYVLADTTVRTNIEGLKIKKFRCSVGSYWGNIVNKTQHHFNFAKVRITTFDKDNDPIGQCIGKITLEPNSGDSFYASGCNCADGKSVRIKVDN